MMFNNGMVGNVHCNILKDILISEFMLVESGEIVYTSSVHKLSTCSVYTMIGYVVGSIHKAIESVQGTI